MSDPRREPRMITRLRERQETHRTRGPIYRGAFVVGGFVVLVAGIAMLALPGPAFVVIPIGLAILSLEFAWAGRLLEHAATAQERTRGMRGRVTILVACAVAAAIGAVAALMVVFDLP